MTNIVYHIVSDGFFVAWLIRLFVVRKRYFAFHSYVSPTPPEEIKPRKSRLERYMEEHRDEIMAREQQLYARQQERALNRQRRLYKMQQWKEKLYPAPVFYDAIDLEQFVTPLLPSAPGEE